MGEAGEGRGRPDENVRAVDRRRLGGPEDYKGRDFGPAGKDCRRQVVAGGKRRRAGGEGDGAAGQGGGLAEPAHAAAVEEQADQGDARRRRLGVVGTLTRAVHSAPLEYINSEKS